MVTCNDIIKVESSLPAGWGFASAALLHRGVEIGAIDQVGVGVMGCKKVRKLELCFLRISNETNPDFLGFIGDYTTHLYRDCNKPM